LIEYDSNKNHLKVYIVSTIEEMTEWYTRCQPKNATNIFSRWSTTRSKNPGDHQVSHTQCYKESTELTETSMEYIHTRISKII